MGPRRKYSWLVEGCWLRVHCRNCYVVQLKGGAGQNLLMRSSEEEELYREMTREVPAEAQREDSIVFAIQWLELSMELRPDMVGLNRIYSSCVTTEFCTLQSRLRCCAPASYKMCKAVHSEPRYRRHRK